MVSNVLSVEFSCSSKGYIFNMEQLIMLARMIMYLYIFIVFLCETLHSSMTLLSFVFM